MIEGQERLSVQQIIEQYPPRFESFVRGTDEKPVGALVSRRPDGAILFVVPGSIVHYDINSLPARHRLDLEAQRLRESMATLKAQKEEV